MKFETDPLIVHPEFTSNEIPLNKILRNISMIAYNTQLFFVVR